MAERRMFAKSLVVYDRLVDCSHGAQALYFQLNMHADDDGFVGNPKSVLRQIRCTGKHQKELVDKQLLIAFDSGVVVISHWLLHNKIRKDRHRPTIYQEEWQQLVVTENETYCLTDDNQLTTNRQPNDNHLATQDRIGKDRIGKDRLGDDVNPDAGLPKSSSHIFFENSILEFYRKHCQNMKTCTALTENIRANIRKLKDHGWSLEALEEIFQIAGRQPFLCGGGTDGWKAGLEWLCREENLLKVRENQYRTWQSKGNSGLKPSGELGKAELEEIQKLLREG